jgi:hypothetical protein
MEFVPNLTEIQQHIPNGQPVGTVFLLKNAAHYDGLI